MPTVFTRIINGDLPGHFVWSDDLCVGFLSINPISVGHTLVVPRREVDQWTDLDVATAAHLMGVAHYIGNAQRVVFRPRRIGLMIAGFEVPHTHVHVLAIDTMDDMSFANAAATVDHAVLSGFAASIRSALSAAGHAVNAVDSPANG